MNAELRSGDILRIKDRGGQRRMEVVLLFEIGLGLVVAPMVGGREQGGEWDQLLINQDAVIQVWNYLLIAPEQVSNNLGELEEAETRILLRLYASLHEEPDLYEKPDRCADLPARGVIPRVGPKLFRESDFRAVRQQYWAEKVRSFWHADFLH